MFVFTRRQAKELRSMLRATLLDQEPKGQWPVLHVLGSSTGTTVRAQKGDVALQWTVSGQRSPEEIAFRSTLLADVERPSDAPVQLEETEPGRGTASWQEGRVPRSVTFDTVPLVSVTPFPVMPKKSILADLELLPALREATRIAARSVARLSLSRIQLRGKSGEMIATDGRQLLLHRGFDFPWSEGVLIPAVKLFTRKLDWAGEEVHVGKSRSHVVLKTGGWTLALRIDEDSRYPDVAGVLPKQGDAKARLLLDKGDADFLMEALPSLPGNRDDPSPLTLDLHSPPVLRTHGGDGEETTEIELSRSSVEGSPAQVCLNRENVVRLLELGFREARFDNADSPLWSQDSDRLYLFMPIEKGQAVASSPKAIRLTTVANSQPKKNNSTERGKPSMSIRNGHSAEGHAAETTLDDLIAEAEHLRRAHQDVGSRLGKLISALKAQRKQTRVLRQAVASIKGLDLGG